MRLSASIYGITHSVFYHQELLGFGEQIFFNYWMTFYKKKMFIYTKNQKSNDNLLYIYTF